MDLKLVPPTDLEKGKWVTIVRWLDTADAERLIMKASSAPSS